jgi:uncharacterized protein YodC (DUF2158 family)
MANKKFKKGAEVILNSGSPNMTVKGYNEENYTEEENMVDCDWFDKNNTHQSGTFHEDQLTLV